MITYRGVILKESLTNEDVLSNVDIVEVFTKDELNPSDEQPKTWTWYRFQVSEDRLSSVSEQLSKSLKPRAWYTNLWTEGDYLLIFPNRIFRGNSVDDPIWNEAVEFGMSIGIPSEQLLPIEHILHTK